MTGVQTDGRLGRRTLLLGAAALAAFGSTGLTACGGPRLDLVQAHLGRRPAAATVQPTAVDGLSRFSGTVLERIATQTGSANLICSPLSMWMALAMTRNGARGVTATEMDRALQFPDLTDLDDGLNTLDQLLDTRSGKITRGERSGEIQLDLVNQVFGETTMTWRPEFLDALAEFYGTGVARADFIGHPEAERGRINGWVEQQTHDKITGLLPAEVITDDTRMVLVNAIYLKAPWATPFSDPVDGPFTTSGGRVTAKMMTASYLGRAARGDDWQAVEIPYLGGKLAMTVILPDPGAEARVQRALTDGLIGAVLAALTPGATITVTSPTYGFRTRADLVPTLRSLGMRAAFAEDADLSGMTDETRLLITAVVHQGWIAVDQEGTEAAAATAVVASESSARVADRPVELVLDRPFWFVIHDVDTAVPLLVGRVGDPTARPSA